MADVDERLTRLEKLVEEIIALMRQYPVGRAILRKLDIE